MIDLNKKNITNEQVFKDVFFKGNNLKVFPYVNEIEIWNGDTLIAKFDKSWWKSLFNKED